jgi:hypothetical protein
MRRVLDRFAALPRVAQVDPQPRELTPDVVGGVGQLRGVPLPLLEAAALVPEQRREALRAPVLLAQVRLEPVPGRRRPVGAREPVLDHLFERVEADVVDHPAVLEDAADLVLVTVAERVRGAAHVAREGPVLGLGRPLMRGGAQVLAQRPHLGRELVVAMRDPLVDLVQRVEQLHARHRQRVRRVPDPRERWLDDAEQTRHRPVARRGLQPPHGADRGDEAGRALSGPAAPLGLGVRVEQPHGLHRHRA